MTSAFKKYLSFVCILFAAATVGCETTDYEPLLMKKKLNDLESENERLKSEIVELSGSGASNEVAGSTGREEVVKDNSSSKPESSAAPALSAADEKLIRDELENSDVFFLVNAGGFATEADLSECRLGNPAIAKLADFSALTKLVLDGVNTNAETYDELVKLTNLEHLEIGRSSPDAAAFEKLKGLKQLKFLQLLKATLSEDAFKVLSEFPALEQIRCGQTRVGDAELQYLSNLKSLKAIDLSDCNRVTIKGLESLSKCPKLSFLKVWGPAIDDDCMLQVAKMKSLRTLGLNDTKVTDEGFKQLAGLDLREIHLFRTSLGDASLEVISQMPNIVTLNLRDTRLSDQGIAYLTSLAKLERLDLSECNSPGITDAAGPELAKFSNLKDLNLWSTDFSDVGLDPLTGLSKLTRLNLDNTNITDNGVTMLEKMPQLTWLHLGKTKITDAAVVDAGTGKPVLDSNGDPTKGLMSLGKLQYLNISHTAISEDVAYDLDDYFSPKDCTVIMP